MDNFKTAPALLVVAKDRLIGVGGYLPSLLGRFNQMVKDLEENTGSSDYFRVAKVLYFAEMVNNEIDAYTVYWLMNTHIDGISEWRQTEELKHAWSGLKKKRDELYGRLLKAVKTIPRDQLEKSASHYASYLLRFTRPVDPIPQPPKTES